MDIETEVVIDAPVSESAAELEQERRPTNPITDPKPVVEAPPAVEAPEPVPKGVQKRIDRAVRQKYEAEARTRVLEERVAAMEARQVGGPTRPAEPSEPTIDHFDNFDEYVAAKASYIAKQQIESTLTAREQAQAAERAAHSQREVAESWGRKLEQATVEMPDFEEVLGATDLPMTPVMRQAIMESDVGPKLAYYLATHPAEAVQIASMQGTGAVRTLGRIEERLEAARPTAKATNAPAPVVPVGARATVRKDPGKMSDAEYAKWRKSV
jgi:hypothetical protein